MTLRSLQPNYNAEPGRNSACVICSKTVCFCSKLQIATRRKRSFPYGFCNVRYCSSSDTGRFTVAETAFSTRNQPPRCQHVKAAFNVNREVCCTKFQKDLQGNIFFGCLLNIRLVSKMVQWSSDPNTRSSLRLEEMATLYRSHVPTGCS